MPGETPATQWNPSARQPDCPESDPDSALIGGPKGWQKQLAPTVAERFARRPRCLFFEENKLQDLLHQNLAVRIERALHAYALSFKLGHIALMIDVVHLS